MTVPFQSSAHDRCDQLLPEVTERRRPEHDEDFCHQPGRLGWQVGGTTDHSRIETHCVTPLCLVYTSPAPQIYSFQQ